MIRRNKKYFYINAITFITFFKIIIIVNFFIPLHFMYTDVTFKVDFLRNVIGCS